MTRLPKDRDTQLTAAEIAAEALREFDHGKGEPSIRSLAAALQVAPSAIYHHFPSRAAIARAAVDLVWRDALEELLRLVPKPLEADPREVLVGIGVATRRAWLAHYSLAPYMTADPEVDEFTRNSIGLMANLLERIGLEGEAAATAFHAYSSFMLGSVLFAAARRVANDDLDLGAADRRPFRTDHAPELARQSSEKTRLAMDAMMEISATDAARDEELYVRGLRRLIASLTAPD
ncbi:MAG TPA: TetR/AcrR family transcriptional regulator [Solirubrobacterales bacterium]|jgi:AcrR family transcriptional regulator|nr:TetR/AcrR family transcriptional regulator [Solirubrobacterales bacterium]